MILYLSACSVHALKSLRAYEHAPEIMKHMLSMRLKAFRACTNTIFSDNTSKATVKGHKN
jgi:hypothetical protein